MESPGVGEGGICESAKTPSKETRSCKKPDLRPKRVPRAVWASQLEPHHPPRAKQSSEAQPSERHPSGVSRLQVLPSGSRGTLRTASALSSDARVHRLPGPARLVRAGTEAPSGVKAPEVKHCWSSAGRSHPEAWCRGEKTPSEGRAHRPRQGFSAPWLHGARAG